MRAMFSRTRNIIGPEDLARLAQVYEETLGLVTADEGPYAESDFALVSMEVASAVMCAAQRSLHDPGRIEQAVLRRLLNLGSKNRQSSATTAIRVGATPELALAAEPPPAVSPPGS